MGGLGSKDDKKREPVLFTSFPTVFDNFRITGFIDSGSFGEVYAGKSLVSTNLDKIALKFIRKDWLMENYLVKDLESEINILLEMNHPNIVKLVSFTCDSVINGIHYTILRFELVDGGTLNDLTSISLKKLTDVCLSLSFSFIFFQTNLLSIWLNYVLQLPTFILTM